MYEGSNAPNQYHIAERIHFSWRPSLINHEAHKENFISWFTELQWIDHNTIYSSQHIHMEYKQLEVKGPSGPRLLVGGPSGLLTSSFAPFGRSGRETHAVNCG